MLESLAKGLSAEHAVFLLALYLTVKELRVLIPKVIETLRRTGEITGSSATTEEELTSQLELVIANQDRSERYHRRINRMIERLCEGHDPPLDTK